MGLGKGRRDGAGLEALERMEQMFCYESALNSLEKTEIKRAKSGGILLAFFQEKTYTRPILWSKVEQMGAHSLVGGGSE